MEQQTLAILGCAKVRMREVPAHEISMCRGYRDAVRLCMKHSVVKRPESDWAEILGMSKGQFNAVLNSDHTRRDKDRKRHFDPDLIPVLQQEAGNTAVSQYLAMKTTGELAKLQEQLQELAVKRAELEALERKLMGAQTLAR